MYHKSYHKSISSYYFRVWALVCPPWKYGRTIHDTFCCHDRAHNGCDNEKKVSFYPSLKRTAIQLLET